MGMVMVLAGIAVIIFCGIWSVFAEKYALGPIFFALLGVLLVLLGGFVYVQGG